MPELFACTCGRFQMLSHACSGTKCEARSIMRALAHASYARGIISIFCILKENGKAGIRQQPAPEVNLGRGL